MQHHRCDGGPCLRQPDIALAVQAKRELSKLWESIDHEPYTLLFNERLTAEVLWRAVRILRAVEGSLRQSLDPAHPRADLISIHGNRFILYRVFQDPQIKPFKDPAPLGRSRGKCLTSCNCRVEKTGRIRDYQAPWILSAVAL